MNSSMAVSTGAGQQEDLAFLAFPAKKAEAQVSRTTTDLFSSISAMLSQILTDALCARSAAQFTAFVNGNFGNYMQIMLGLSKMIRATVPDSVIDRLTFESLSEMEADFRDAGPSAIGEELTNQVLFTVWTLRKINDLANRIFDAGDIAPDQTSRDQALAADFVKHVLLGRFHLDCLKLSVHSGRPVYPEVIECMSNGLRPVVNAYSYIKQAYDLRCSHPEEAMIEIDFDEEEQELLALSMGDSHLED